MNEPIDRQNISLGAACAILVLATSVVFGISTGIAYAEARLAAVEQHDAEQTQLLTAICAKLNCDAEGMRK